MKHLAVSFALLSAMLFSISAHGYERAVELIYAELSDAERVGQMLMFGFRGKELTPEVRTYITTYKIGGIVLFSHNLDEPRQVARLCRSLQDLAGSSVPLLIATDQEGGRVVRLTQGVTVFPGNMALGAADSYELSYLGGRITGMELRSLGISMNLAPVVDLNSSPQNEVIDTRSYGANAQRVALQSYWYIKGLQEEGVSATAKHFPGHGSTTRDSHHALPTVETPLDILAKEDLKPFSAAIEGDVDAVMTAHVHYRAFDRDPLPGSLSSNVLSYLRNTMMFRGLVLSDGLEMGAIAKTRPLAEAAIEAINAGNDMIVAGWNAGNLSLIHQAIFKAVESGRIPRSRLKDAVCRVLGLKLKRRLFVRDQLDWEATKSMLDRKYSKTVAESIAARAITMVKGEQEHLTKLRESGKLVIISGMSGFITLTRRIFPNAIIVRFTKDGSERADGIRAVLKSADVVLWSISNHKEAKVLKELSKAARSKIVVSSFGSPYSLLDFPDVMAYLCAYSATPPAVEALAEVLSGVRRPLGKLPVSLPGLHVPTQTTL